MEDEQRRGADHADLIPPVSDGGADNAHVVGVARATRTHYPLSHHPGERRRPQLLHLHASDLVAACPQVLRSILKIQATTTMAKEKHTTTMTMTKTKMTIRIATPIHNRVSATKTLDPSAKQSLDLPIILDASHRRILDPPITIDASLRKSLDRAIDARL